MGRKRERRPELALSDSFQVESWHLANLVARQDAGEAYFGEAVHDPAKRLRRWPAQAALAHALAQQECGFFYSASAPDMHYHAAGPHAPGPLAQHADCKLCRCTAAYCSASRPSALPARKGADSHAAGAGPSLTRPGRHVCARSSIIVNPPVRGCLYQQQRISC